MTDRKLAMTCAVLAGLGGEHRIRIIDQLRTGSRNVGQLAKAIGVEYGTAVHHLRILRQAGLVTSEKIGRTVVYSLAPPFQDGTTLDLEWFRVVLVP